MTGRPDGGELSGRSSPKLVDRRYTVRHHRRDNANVGFYSPLSLTIQQALALT